MLKKKYMPATEKTIETPKTPLRLCSPFIDQRIIDGALARIYLTTLPKSADDIGWQAVAVVSMHRLIIPTPKLSNVDTALFSDRTSSPTI
jgi:hypothetical protein